MNRKQKPRILFVATLPPPIHGSAVVSQQIKDCKIINDMFRCDWVNLGTSRRMDEIGKRTLMKPFRFIGSWLCTAWLLMTHRYALCYLAITCHGIGFLKDAPFMLLARLFCNRRVIHQHNKGMADCIDKWPYRWLLPLCYKNAKVILLSWHLYEDISRIVPRENILICPNGIKVNNNVDLGDNQETWNTKPKTQGIPRLLFLSNLIESKGVLVLLDALKLLADKGYSFQCDFVGSETKEIDAKRFADEVDKRRLNNQVFYLGRKYGEEKEDVYERSDVFIFPTYYETFGLVNLEAMAHKLPIISTNEGGIPDIVKDGENGLIANSRDAESLADCIRRLLVDADLRKQMGEDGFRKLHRCFTEEVFERTLLECLNKSLRCDQ